MNNIVVVFLALFFSAYWVSAQNTDISGPKGKTKSVKDTVSFSPEKKEFLEGNVDYKADNSTMSDMIKREVYLHDKAEVSYLDINLKAGYIKIDWKTNTVYATGVRDNETR